MNVFTKQIDTTRVDTPGGRVNIKVSCHNHCLAWCRQPFLCGGYSWRMCQHQGLTSQSLSSLVWAAVSLRRVLLEDVSTSRSHVTIIV